MVRKDAHLALLPGGNDDIRIPFKYHAVLETISQRIGIHTTFLFLWSSVHLSGFFSYFFDRPTIMKACSGKSSCLPSRISRKPRTVSRSGTYRPPAR